MKQKTCKKCNITKPLTLFYKEPRLFDGHSNSCKMCKKKQSNDYRKSNLEKVREYDRNRPNTLLRLEKERTRKKTKQQILNKRKSNQLWAKNNKIKKRAHAIVQRAILVGEINKKPCVVCGDTKSEAHHENYNEPMNIVFYCRQHHQERHRILNKIKRMKKEK